VTADEIGDPGALRIVTRVNGEIVQDGNTADLIFTSDQIAACASGCLTLRPGDVLVTGTPRASGSPASRPGSCVPATQRRWRSSGSAG
jgi:2-keto-4-pentenoate hydratase/2-oxohepta-3-ene-1,7-dioic acid hydratase in catechol pathway